MKKVFLNYYYSLKVIEIIESIATEEKTQIKEEIQPLEIPIQNISELEVSKIIENLPKDEEFPQRLEIDSDNQEGNIKIYKNLYIAIHN